jgi:hypothetical protein
MNPKRVFILGAGFSKQAGMPLATELTPLLRATFEEYDQEEALEWLYWLDERISWLNHTDKTGGSSLNIEELFDIAYFDSLTWKLRQQMCPLGRKAGDTPYSKAIAIEAWLSYMEHDLVDVIWSQQQSGMQHIDKVAEFTSTLHKTDSVVTFNYDTLVEESLSLANHLWHYGFDLEKGQGTKILKMHGSINWAIVPRNQVDHFGYSLLFRKEDQNITDDTTKPIGESEYDYALLCVPNESLANRIKNRILQISSKQYKLGLAGLGRYKPLDHIPGSGRVWHNAGRALYLADEIYIIGFSLSYFDTMARLHFAGAMLERNEKGNLPKRIVLVDPSAGKLKKDFQSVFGLKPEIEVIQEYAENVNWDSLF